jgi:hypothetical protein
VSHNATAYIYQYAAHTYFRKPYIFILNHSGVCNIWIEINIGFVCTITQGPYFYKHVRKCPGVGIMFEKKGVKKSTQNDKTLFSYCYDP